MKQRIAVVLAGILVLAVITNCGNETGIVEDVDYPISPTFNLSTLTTQIPVDPGALHNAILT